MQKEITNTQLSQQITDLAKVMGDLAKTSATNTNLENLAAMTAQGFDDIKQQLHSEINRLDIRLDQMASRFEITVLKKRVSKIEGGLNLT